MLERRRSGGAGARPEAELSERAHSVRPAQAPPPAPPNASPWPRAATGERRVVACYTVPTLVHCTRTQFTTKKLSYAP